MEKKILQFEKSADLYFKIASRKREEGDIEGCLSALFTAYNLSNDVDYLAEIAYEYAEIGDIQASNQYWFYFIINAPKSRWSEAYGELAKNCLDINDVITAALYANQRASLGEGIGDIDFILELKEAVEQLIDEEIKFRLIDTDRLKREIKSTDRAGRYLGMKKFAEAYVILNDTDIKSLSIGECETYFYACELNQEYEQAEKVLNEMKERFPDDLRTLSASCIYYKTVGNEERAKCSFISLLSYPEKDEEYFSELYNISCLFNDTKCARVAVTKLLNTKKYDSSLFFDNAFLFLYERDLQNAKKWFIKAYKFSPDNYIYRYYAKKAMSEDANELLNFKIKDFVPILPDKVIKTAIKEFERITSPKAKGKIKYSVELEETIICALEEYNEKFLTNGLIRILKRCDKKVERIFINYLVSTIASTSVKEKIIKAMLLCGYKKNIFVSEGNRLYCIKHGKSAFFHSKSNTVYKNIYISTISNSLCWDESYASKARKAINKVYLKATELELDLSEKEVYCLINFGQCDDEEIRSHCNDNDLDFDYIKILIKIIYG